MKHFLIGRFSQAAVTLLFLSFVVFISVRLTGDPAQYLLGPAATLDDYRGLVQQMGLDKPLPEQYALFLGRVVRGDFGTSYITGRPAREAVAERLPATLMLAGAGFTVQVVLGISLGVLAAVRRNKLSDRLARFVAVLGIGMPGFWVATMLILLFGGVLNWLPTFGMQAGPQSLILPALVLGWEGSAGMFRLVRASMLDVLDSEYVKFARIKGLPERMVVYKHALRNAIFPPLTFGGIQLARLLNGAVAVEVVFGWPGMGRLMLQAVTQRDYSMIQATVLTAAFGFILMALFVDILYAYLDPRIRYAR